MSMRYKGLIGAHTYCLNLLKVEPDLSVGNIMAIFEKAGITSVRQMVYILTMAWKYCSQWTEYNALTRAIRSLPATQSTIKKYLREEMMTEANIADIFPRESLSGPGVTKGPFRLDGKRVHLEEGDRVILEMSYTGCGGLLHFARENGQRLCRLGKRDHKFLIQGITSIDGLKDVVRMLAEILGFDLKEEPAEKYKTIYTLVAKKT